MAKNPLNRLGNKGGINDIKNHVFFKDVNWKNIENFSVKAPYMPDVKN
jgi:hypothetical protein